VVGTSSYGDCAQADAEETNKANPTLEGEGIDWHKNGECLFALLARLGGTVYNSQALVRTPPATDDGE
jgi:hypothetical protein